jgi:hypothetical protein
MEIELDGWPGKTTSWRGSPALVAAFAFVCLSVFAWGLRYKLSLYDAQEEARPSMPAAKLLSPRERPLATAQQLQPTVSVKTLPVAPLSRWTIAVLIGLALYCLLIVPAPIVRAKQLWCLAPIDSKPPPVLA